MSEGAELFEVVEGLKQDLWDSSDIQDTSVSGLSSGECGFPPSRE